MNAIGPDLSLSTLMDVLVQNNPPVYAMESVSGLGTNDTGPAYNPASTDCFTGCNANALGAYMGPSNTGMEIMVGKFTTPVDNVSVTFSSGLGGWVQAFNGQGQLIGYTSGVFFSEGVLGLGAPNISTIAISSYLGESQVQSIAYSVPEPSTSALFGLACLLLWAWRTKWASTTRT